MEIMYIVRHFNGIQSYVLLFKLFCIRKMNTRAPLVYTGVDDGTLVPVYIHKGDPCAQATLILGRIESAIINLLSWILNQRKGSKSEPLMIITSGSSSSILGVKKVSILFFNDAASISDSQRRIKRLASILFVESIDAEI